MSIFVEIHIMCLFPTPTTEKCIIALSIIYVHPTFVSDTTNATYSQSVIFMNIRGRISNHDMFNHDA